MKSCVIFILALISMYNVFPTLAFVSLCLTPNNQIRQTLRPTHRPPSKIYGLFDAFKGAFDIGGAFANAEYSAPPEGIKASASHILVPSEDIAIDIKKRVTEGEFTFAQAAQKFSTCNSKAQGGSLGSFPPGRMVREFDDVIFDPKTEVPSGILGPVTTKFGVHLIVVGKRTGCGAG